MKAQPGQLGREGFLAHAEAGGRLAQPKGEAGRPSREEEGRRPGKRTPAQPECKCLGPAGKGCYPGPGWDIPAWESIFRPRLG
jgi:hypothetical protein